MSVILEEIPSCIRVPERDCNLILHNDNSVFYATVIEGLVTVVGLDVVKARRIMLEAHTHGKSLIIKTNLYVAESYKEQLETGYGLTITIEKE